MLENKVETLKGQWRGFCFHKQASCDKITHRFPLHQLSEKGRRTCADAAIQTLTPLEKPPGLILIGERMKRYLAAGDDLFHDAGSSNDHLCLSKHITQSRGGTRPVL